MFVEDGLSVLAVEPPLNHEAGAVNPLVPRLGFDFERAEVRNAARSEALPGKQTDFDFGLVEPTAVFGCVMQGEPTPECVCFFLPKVRDQRFPAVGVQVVDHQVDLTRSGALVFSRGGTSSRD